MNIYKHIYAYLQQIDDPIVFELGMHWAEDTIRIINSCKSSPAYYGFEPDSRNIKKINEQVQRYNLDVNIIHGAISNQIGETTLYLSDGIHERSGNQMTGANSIRKPKEVVDRFKWIDFKGEETVKTYTIDQFCKDNGVDHIDFIWSDIQGCEYDMIEGALKMLPTIGMMLLEYSDIELYAGQKGLSDILKLLGSDWEVVVKTNADILVKKIR